MGKGKRRKGRNDQEISLAINESRGRLIRLKTPRRKEADSARSS